MTWVLLYVHLFKKRNAIFFDMGLASGEGRIRRRFDPPRSAGRLSLWVCLFVCLSLCLSVCLFVYLTWVQLQGREGLDADLIRGEAPTVKVYGFVCLSFSLFVCLSVCLFI